MHANLLGPIDAEHLREHEVYTFGYCFHAFMLGPYQHPGTSFEGLAFRQNHAVLLFEVNPSLVCRRPGLTRAVLSARLSSQTRAAQFIYMV